jgi:hypothetical protein
VELTGDKGADDARDETAVETWEVVPVAGHLSGGRGHHVVGYEVQRSGELGESLLAVAVRATADGERLFRGEGAVQCIEGCQELLMV